MMVIRLSNPLFVMLTIRTTLFAHPADDPGCLLNCRMTSHHLERVITMHRSQSSLDRRGCSALLNDACPSNTRIGDQWLPAASLFKMAIGEAQAAAHHVVHHAYHHPHEQGRWLPQPLAPHGLSHHGKDLLSGERF